MSDSKPRRSRSLLPARPRQVIGEMVIDSVDKAVTSRWEPAQRRAEPYLHLEPSVAVKQVRRAFRTELGVAGAAAGGAAAVPGSMVPGLAAGAAEIGWSTVRLADLILTIAVIHGNDRASVEERRAWVLSILAFGDGASTTFSKLASETAKGLGGKATRAIPASALQAVNRKIGRTIITKYGTKRGAIALGRMIPFGFGAGIGFGLNAALVWQVCRSADKFFRALPPELAEQPSL